MPIDITDTIEPARLGGATFDDLERYFAAGDAPQVAELDGLYRGRVVALAGWHMLPGAVRRTFAAFMAGPLFPWVGKRFGGNRHGGRIGVDAWLTIHGPDIGRFNCRRSETDLTLDYDIASNPRPIRNAQCELRRIAPGVYLGRLGYRFAERRLDLAYFTLDDAD